MKHFWKRFSTKYLQKHSTYAKQETTLEDATAESFQNNKADSKQFDSQLKHALNKEQMNKEQMNKEHIHIPICYCETSIDHFWEYVGDPGAMATEALESQHKDFRFPLSQLAYHGDIQRALDDATKSMLLSTSEVLNETMAAKPTMVHHCSNCGSSLHRVNKCYLNCSNCHSHQHKSNNCELPCSRCQSTNHKLIFHKKEKKPTYSSN